MKIHYLIIPLCLFAMVSCDFIKEKLGFLTKDKISENSEKQINNKRRTRKSARQRKDIQMDYLEENKKKEGIKVTGSGLQYKVLQEGTGASPEATDKVEVHYLGELIDGKKFDSSYDRGQSITFGLNQVIKGWTEGLQLMKEGSTYNLYIPSHLAYGDQELPGIPGGSTLIFKVELIKVL